MNRDHHFLEQGAQRLQLALEGVPDRVPVCAQLHELAMAESRVGAADFYRNGRILAEATVETHEKYCIDAPVLDYDVYNIEAEALGQALIYSDRHPPDVDRSRPLIRDRDDLKKIKTPDFDVQGRFSMVLEANRVFRSLIGGADTAVRFCGPFSLAANIRGLESLLMDMALDPGFARALFDRVVEEVLVPWIQRLKREFPGVRSICGDDAASSVPIVSPVVIREWILPYVLKLRRECGPEVYVPNWVGERYLKDPEEMLDLKLRACPRFIQGQDPDVESLGPAFYKEYARRHQVPLVLGVGAGFLALSPPAVVAARVRRYLEAAAPGGRFVLYLCNLAGTTPRENIRAAVQAVRHYGTYSSSSC